MHEHVISQFVPGGKGGVTVNRNPFALFTSITTKKVLKRFLKYRVYEGYPKSTNTIFFLHVGRYK